MKASLKPVDRAAAQEALKYCLDIVKTRDYENYTAMLLMPKRAQCHVTSILALNAEVALIRHKIKRNSGVAGIYQLQFWKDALNTIYGQKPGPAPRQPVVTALRAYAERADLGLLQKLVEARTETLGDRPFKNVETLEKHADDIHGSLIRLMAQALGPEDEGWRGCDEAGSAMGKAVGIATLLRATIPLLKEGVVLLPADLLAIHGLDENSIFSNKNPEAFKALSRDMCEISSHHLKTSRSHQSSIDKRLRSAFLASGCKVDYLLKTFEKNGYNILDGRLQKPDPLLNWRLWWRNLRHVY